MILIRRLFLVLILICLGCVAQSAPPDLARKIERQVRAFYNIPAEVHVVVGAMTPITDWPAYDTVSVTIDGGESKKAEYKFLVSKDRNTMLRMVKFDLTKDPFADVMSKIDTAGRPSRGAKSAKVMLVNFDDFECPFCSRMHQTLFPELLKEYGDRVTFVYKDYPLVEIHPWATHAAVDANCLAAQNVDAYWDFADYIHGNQAVVNSEKGRDNQFAALDRITLNEGAKFKVDTSQLQACMKANKENAVTASVKEGEYLGIDGTPTMFVNGRMLNGARSVAELRSVFDNALQQAGVAAPAHPSASVNPPVQPRDSATR